jgi:hypothetical protein
MVKIKGIISEVGIFGFISGSEDPMGIGIMPNGIKT